MRTAFSTFRFSIFLGAALGLRAIITTAFHTSVTSIDFDQAFNLQVAKSLATHFRYSTTYQPAGIYVPAVTTNGPIQYFAAAVFALTKNVDAVTVWTTTATMTLLVMGLFLIRPWLATLPFLLLMIWPTFFATSNSFLGDIWGTAFILIGIALLRRPFDPSDLKGVCRKPFFYLAAWSFGIAVATKLLLFFSIVPIVYALAYQSMRNTPSPRGVLFKMQSAMLFTSVICGTAVAFFIAQFAFSVLHSNGFQVGMVWGTLNVFIARHFGLVQSHHFTFSDALTQIHTFTSPFFLTLCALSALALLLTSWSYLFFIVIALLLCFFYGLSERELVPTLSLLFFLGMNEAEFLLHHLTGRMNQSTITASRAGAAALLALLWIGYSMGKSHLVGPEFFALHRNDNRAYVVQCCGSNFHYKPALLTAIRAQRYVVTSGWWQFPEISLRSGFQFYDRMAPANADLPKHDVALLFDKGNHDFPMTSQAANCSSLIYSDGRLILCRVRTNQPLNFQPFAKS